jgi:hypothetical protein
VVDISNRRRRRTDGRAGDHRFPGHQGCAGNSEHPPGDGNAIGIVGEPFERGELLFPGVEFGDGFLEEMFVQYTECRQN